MSHGGGGADKAAEPNLTPLLDVVLQLVMFFMLCANFTMEQVNEDVKLPTAQSAKPMDSTLTDVLYVNVDAKGRVLVLNHEPLETPAAIKLFLQQQASDLKLAARGKNPSAGDTLNTTVIIRAHQNADFAKVYGVLRLAKDSGFRKLQLRAIQQAQQGG